MSAQYWIWLERMPVAQVDMAFGARGGVTSSGLTYLHTDHLNAPRLASDQSQKLVWRWDSDAYGVGGLDEDVDRDGVATRVDLRFPGQVHDAGSGLSYNYFRDYDSGIGRYVRSDPIGLRGGLNTYGYVTGNPLKFKDPLGLATTIIITRDLGIGSHAAIYNDHGDNGNAMLYDPAGYYLQNQRGTGDMFYDSYANLNAYVQYHRNLGSTVNVYTFATTPDEERQIHNNADTHGGVGGGWCSIATSSVINGVGPFSGLGIYFLPGSLEAALKEIQGEN